MSNTDYIQQLIDISNNLTTTLQNYKNKFVSFGKRDITRNTYISSVNNIKSYLTQANELLTNLNNMIDNTQTNLTTEKNQFSDKKEYYGKLNNKLNSADTLKDDFNSLYNEQSLRNSEMFLGVIFLGLVIFGISRQ